MSAAKDTLIQRRKEVNDALAVEQSNLAKANANVDDIEAKVTQLTLVLADYDAAIALLP